jgi:Cu(I)/Ag(I) efflux system membrane fusion protein
MNTLIKFTFLLILVAAGSFWFGQHQAAPTATINSVPSERKILYYRNPMGLPDTSPVPKLDSMGMDYVPVYAEDQADAGSVVLSPEKIQLLGVRTEVARHQTLLRQIRASAIIEVDERKQHWVAPRFEGWIQQLHVNTTGQQVTRGQALFTVYSPELESAVREVQLAHSSGLSEVEQSARHRLDNWQMAEQDWKQFVFRAPIDGVVIEKLAVEGARFAAGDVLFKLVDLSKVWLQAEVAEQDQAALQIGQTVAVKIEAYPNENWVGKISFIAPLLNEKTRTVRVRVELANPNARLRPGMFASLVIADKLKAQLLIPLSAVIDSGTRQTVLVQVAIGRFQARAVQLGARNDEQVAVLAGLAEGETVVTQANFLIDAESNLRAAFSGMQATSAVPPAHQHGGH